MELISGNKVVTAVAVGAAVVVGYCLYFDKKRRSDPLFKEKLKERRRKNRELLQQKNKRGIPDLKDHSAVQQYFLQEIQLGETLLAAGDLDNGVEHLANALTVCGQPNQLLGVLQQTLPPNVFNALIEKLPPAGIRIVGEPSTVEELGLE
ncbi:hypothetical protein M8J77_018433 [Diaphorina citri]|nr:hypothetical protein M8J77_018433 [Diaphorina citri]